jgi:peptidoglycan/xylan/chitin deacetylase (PgdA/CDA1 family)
MLTHPISRPDGENASTVPASGQNAIPVLLYHSVPLTRDPEDSLSVPYEQFGAHLDAIVASARTPITVGKLAAALRGECQLPDRPVAITFDDAYENTLDAVELLGSRGLCASVYVTTGEIGTDSMVRLNQLERLAAQPSQIELGAHTVTHPFLDELSLAEIEREVTDSKHRLEQLTGRGIDTFAYPYGAYDRRVRAAVIAAGYRSAAAVKNALSHPGDDPWAIARWTVRSTTSAQRIAGVLEGRGVPFAWREERLRTRGYRFARRLRRRIVRGEGAKEWR